MKSSLSFTITGSQKLEKKFQQFQKECLAGQVKAVQDSTFLLHETAVGLIQDNSSGIPQVRYTNGRKRTVLASRPGDPPNTDTGRLVQSVKFDFQNGGLTGRVGTNLKYGAALEFGTLKMAARPWLSTAVRIITKQVSEIFARAVKDAIKGVKT